MDKFAMKISKRSVLLALFVCSMSTPLPAGAQVKEIPRTLSLADALQIAAQRNPGLLTETTNRQIARGDATTAALLPNPELLLRSEGFRGGSFIDRQELFFEVSQEIPTAGKRSQQIAVAGAHLRATEADVDNTARLLRFVVKQTYYQIVLAKTDLAVARGLLADFDRTIRAKEEQFQLGEISGAELRRVQVERFRVFDDVVAGELNLKQARAALLALLGYADSTAEFDVTEELLKGGPIGGMESLHAEAMETRPDLNAQRQRAVRAREQKALERARRFPNLFPFVGYKRNFSEDSVLFGVAAPLPLFNRNQGGIVRAQAEEERESFQSRRLETQALLEVDQAFNRFESERRRLEGLETEYLPKARESREIAEAAHKLGAIDLTAFLDAQRTFREVQRLYNRSLYELSIARFQVEAAVGR
ncbi:outer membrane efflux protein [Candidatus Methylomirabilis lanthanidiphila]|uniref:Outer membrane efflux protein n=1 Tax=Candidatus Methylomirabilis lanthanidiphila TaxID=2211376 RepID=A0A564ZHJ9_9BACT|nr:TolC family protein [Candidatus Methylomirabilis lanthanidiphila]VUZ84596.1 outer membrane efflux protein [Candidatus Methylomirabilis lanthanidiphila]